MPKITQHNIIDVSVTKFLNQCTPEELMELVILLNSKKYQFIIENHLKKHHEQALPTHRSNL